MIMDENEYLTKIQIEKKENSIRNRFYLFEESQ